LLRALLVQGTVSSFKTDKRDIVVKAINGTELLIGLLYEKLPLYLQNMTAPFLNSVRGLMACFAAACLCIQSARVMLCACATVLQVYQAEGLRGLITALLRIGDDASGYTTTRANAVVDSLPVKTLHYADDFNSNSKKMFGFKYSSIARVSHWHAGWRVVCTCIL
jgi:hypothetical protein